MHDSIYLLLVEDMPHQIGRLNITLDKLHKTMRESAAATWRSAPSDEFEFKDGEYAYFEIRLVLCAFEIVQRGAIIQLVQNNNLH